MAALAVTHMLLASSGKSVIADGLKRRPRASFVLPAEPISASSVEDQFAILLNTSYRYSNFSGLVNV